jgi:hypothetical protein
MTPNERLERLAELRTWLAGRNARRLPPALALSVDAAIASQVMRGGATLH